MGTLARSSAVLAATVVLLVGRAEAGPPGEPDSSRPGIAGLEEVLASEADLWGEAALNQPGGPTYAFFEGLLPPLRYVDADFRHYPIVLSAPGATVKGRLVGNGSAINARARQPNWNNESGTPVHILVGRHRDPFGSDLSRL